MCNSFLQERGNYAGFDEAEFTSRSGGKPAAIRHIKVVDKECSLALLMCPEFFFRSCPNCLPPHTPTQKSFGYTTVVMVGDGATDLEARLEGAAELFIG